MHLKRSRRYKVRPAERRKKIVQRDLVGDIDSAKPKRHLRVFSTEKIIGADAEIEEIARSDSRGIRVVVFLSVRGNHHAQSATIRRTARQDWRCWRREGAATEQSDLGLLIRAQTEGGIEIRH